MLYTLYAWLVYACILLPGGALSACDLQCQQEQRRALMSLYEATHGQDWDRSLSTYGPAYTGPSPASRRNTRYAFSYDEA